MIEGRDSAFAPNDAQLTAFFAAGVRVYGGYIKLGNDGLYHGWSQADFDRVRAHGMTPIAYMSGWDDPRAARAAAAAWGISLVALDDEGGIRGDGPWVQPWLDAASAGLYGNAQWHVGRRAAFHVMAAYPIGGDPGGASWPSWAPRPAGPCMWQWAGSHNEYGLTVDSAWCDDSFAPAYSGGLTQLLGGHDLPVFVLRHTSDGSEWTLNASYTKKYAVNGPKATHLDELAKSLGQPGLVSIDADAFLDMITLGDAGPAPAPFDPTHLEAAVAAVKAELDQVRSGIAPLDLSSVDTTLANVQTIVTAIRATTDRDLK